MSGAIVVGAGHNGLVAAAILARAGLAPVVLEAGSVPGGLCAGAEFHPGFRHTGIHHDTDALRPAVFEALGLDKHGLSLQRPPPVRAAGGAMLDGTDPVTDFVRGLRPLVASLFDAPPPKVTGDAPPSWALLQRVIAFRRLGADRMLELMRVAVMSAEDWLAESIPDPRVRAAIALPALLGTFQGPRSPQSAAMVLLRRALSGDEVRGGPARLVEVLAEVARADGARIELGQRVARIRVERGEVKGVVLADGTAIDAPIVVSALGPRATMLDLVPPFELPPACEDEVRAIRVRATSAKLHLALSGLPADAPERFVAAQDPNTIERAFDDAKHGRMPRRPVLEARIPSLADPSLAPAGQHVLSAHVFGVAYAVEGGWTDEARAALLDRALGSLEEALPGVAAKVVGAELLVPPDLEARYGLAGGHLMHGEHALDKLWAFRPGPALSGHATPIRGLYLASGGTHPGGGATGVPGLLAARAVTEQR